MCGLYIHIPFCVKKCKYCDFNSFSNLNDLFEDYFSCLEKEIEKINREEIIFDTVYIGGGTPTAVPNSYLTNLLKKIKNKTRDCEITVECNPGTVNLCDFENLKNAGVTRLSIGLQSADDEELKMLGRIHNLKQFEECFYDARKAGFDNISIDIMFGLPDQTDQSLERTLQKAISYNPEHISCYCLKIEEGTPFAKMKLNLPSDDESADMYELCVNYLEKCGYHRYEISNFAKNAKISKHNTKYWRLEDYIGIGAGAHSFYKNKRFSMISDVAEYISSVSSGESGVFDIMEISSFEKMSEFVFLGLRMTDGIKVSDFKSLFGKSIYDVFGEQIKKYISLGVMGESGGRIFIKPEFLYVSNNIMSDFV